MRANSSASAGQRERPNSPGTMNAASSANRAQRGSAAAASQPAYVVAPAPGYVVYSGYAAPLPGPNCYWSRMPLYDAYGNVIGWRGRPVAVCQ